MTGTSADASVAGSGAGWLLVYRRLVDLLDRRVELGVELLVGLVFGQPFEKRAREAGDEGGIACEPGAGFVTAVAARQGDDPQDAWVSRQVAVQARPGRDGDLQYDGCALGQRLDVLGDGVAQQRLSLLLVRAGAADFGLDDRHEAGGPDPARVAELLVHDRRDPGLVGVVDHRSHFGTEDLVPLRALEQIIEGVDELHELHAVLLGGKPLVDFQERHHVLLVPQIPRRGDAVDVPFHGLLEQDRRENAGAIKRRAGQHTGPHGVDEVEHLGVGAVAVPLDAVLGQRLGRAAAALVKGSEETAAGPDLLELDSVHPSLFWHPAGPAGPEGMPGAMNGAAATVPRAGRQRAARRRTPPSSRTAACSSGAEVHGVSPGPARQAVARAPDAAGSAQVRRIASRPRSARVG